jgi:hypothetical protein
VTVAYPLFQAGGGGSIPTSPLSLRLYPIPLAEAADLNRRWHSRLPRFGTGCVKNQPYLCYGAEFDGRWFAVAIWSNPVARLLPQREWLELRRLAIAPDAPRNTASRLLGIMAKLIRRARPEVLRLISYQDADAHTGAIYRAAGWVAVELPKASQTRWDAGTRPRPPSQSESPKCRWEKIL